MVHILAEEATAGDGTNTDMLGQPFAEMKVIFHTIF